MTQAAGQASAKEVLHDVTICGITIQARATDEKLYTAMRVRVQLAERRGSDEAAVNALVAVLVDVFNQLVPDADQVDSMIDLIATGQVTADELVQQICMAGANRAERRAADRPESAARREPAGGRRRSGQRRR